MSHNKQESEKKGSPVAGWLTGSLAAAVGIDLWSHPHPGNWVDLVHIFPKADLARRATIAALGPVGSTVAEHLGNYGYAAAFMIPMVVLGHATKELGIRRNSRFLEKLGEFIPFMGFLGLAAMTLYIESITPNNNQTSGDLISATIGAAHGAITTHVALKPWRRGGIRYDKADKVAPTTKLVVS